ncbi:hypothetical protein Taro_036499, partial [Colocasia esculenta]|nr:hypothetical protein [Colocasia esculenta]
MRPPELWCSVASFPSGAAAGPFVHGCETKRCTCVVCPSLWLVSRTNFRDSCMAYPSVACTRIRVCHLHTYSCSILHRYCYIYKCFTVLYIMYVVLYVYRLWENCPTEPVTCEAHPFFFQVKESRRIPVPLLVQDCTIVESGLHHQQSNVFTCGALGVFPELLYLFKDLCMELNMLRPDRGRRSRVGHVIGLKGLNGDDRHNGTVINAMLTTPATQSRTCLPPAFFGNVTRLVTMLALGFVWGRGGKDLGLSLLAWPVSDAQRPLLAI